MPLTEGEETRMDRKARQAYEKLISIANMQGSVFDGGDGRSLEHARSRGEPIPEKCKPGYLLRYLSEDERKEIQSLSSDDVKNDVPAEIWYELTGKK